MTRAVMSNLTLEIAEKCGIRPDALLKNAAIAYETIFFHPGLFDRIIDYTDAQMLSGWASSSGEANRLASEPNFIKIFPSVTDIFPESPQFNQDIGNVLRRQRPEMLDGMRRIAAQAFDVSEEAVQTGAIRNTWRNIPAFALHDILVLGKLRQIDGEIMGVFAPAHVLLLAADIVAEGVTDDPLGHLLLKSEDSEVSQFPSFENLSWNEIFELRADPRVKLFRKKLQKIASGCLRYPLANWTTLWHEYVRDWPAPGLDDTRLS
jgi:hypothetical protein